MTQDKEDFARRWSRLKRKAEEEQRTAAAAPRSEPPAQVPPAQLPPVDSLTFESDFKDFMHSRVTEDVKRAALKKLFSDPRFNVIDPLDIDIDDYSKLERIPEAMAATLAHAKRALFGPPVEEKEGQAAAKEGDGERAEEERVVQDAPVTGQAQAKEAKPEDDPKG